MQVLFNRVHHVESLTDKLNTDGAFHAFLRILQPLYFPHCSLNRRVSGGGCNQQLHSYMPLNTTHWNLKCNYLCICSFWCMVRVRFLSTVVGLKDRQLQQWWNQFQCLVSQCENALAPALAHLRSTTWAISADLSVHHVKDVNTEESSHTWPPTSDMSGFCATSMSHTEQCK